MTKTLLTGSTGLIGSAIARHLIEAGDQVRLLTRPGSDERNIEGLDAERVPGDLLDASSLDVAVKGCDRVFNCAGKVSFWVAPAERREFYTVNVLGTRNLLEASRRHEVDRFVQTSTISAIGVHPGGGETTEEDYYTLWDMGTDYEHSKYAADHEVLQYAARGLGTVIVHPTAPLGWRDRTPNPVGQIVLDYLAGKLPRIDGGMNLVDVEDVAAGHLLAAERGKPGERYILGHANVTLDQVFAVLEEVSGVPVPKLTLTYGLGLVVAHALQFVADRVTKSRPMLTPSMIKMATKHYYASSERARKELGYEPKSNPKLAAARAILWFLDEGYVSGNEEKRTAIRRHAQQAFEAASV